MPDYKYAETSYAMRKIREMFALANELAPQIERCKQRYSAELANEKIMEFRQQYRTANEEARKAVKNAAQAARARVERARSDMLHIGNAEEDFKLLALPVTLSRDELRAMVKRNEGNYLFARAVSQYAHEHKYEEPDFRALANPLSFNDDLHTADEAFSHLMRYCEEDRLDVVIANDWHARAFNKVDALGLYVNL